MLETRAGPGGKKKNEGRWQGGGIEKGYTASSQTIPPSTKFSSGASKRGETPLKNYFPLSNKEMNVRNKYTGLRGGQRG
jgi:hypothetical protein